MPVIQSSHDPVYQSITSIGPQEAQKVQIDTRLATNMFDFEGVHGTPTIDITGKVILMFTNRRKLVMDISDRMLQGSEEDSAEFGVIVNLQSEPELTLEGGEGMMMSSAKAVVGKVFVILGITFASVFALW